RLDARDLVDLVAGPWLHQLVDRAAKRAGVAEQRGDVAKQDARFRVVRNGADGSFQVIFEIHWCLFHFFVIARSACDEAIHLSPRFMDCFAALAMTSPPQ